MNRPEQALQIQVAQFLNLALGGRATWLHIPNGGYRSRVEAGILKAMGVRAGAPDILVLDGSRACFIELKSAKGSVSEAQRATHSALRRAGCPVCIARSIEDVAAFLERCGVALKARVARSRTQGRGMTHTQAIMGVIRAAQ